MYQHDDAFDQHEDEYASIRVDILGEDQAPGENDEQGDEEGEEEVADEAEDKPGMCIDMSRNMMHSCRCD